MTSFGTGKRRFALTLGCVLLSLLFFCGLAVASGGGDQGGAHDSGKMLDLLYRCINFSLLVIILFVVIKKTSVKDFFSARREEIKKRFDDLKREREAGKSRYQELEKQLKGFEIEKRGLIEKFKQEGLAEKERIIAEAKERADQILAQADMTIEREIRETRDRLRQDAVNIATLKAQELIAREIKSGDQDQLVNEFIEGVEKLH